jgi:hypothetical protein
VDTPIEELLEEIDEYNDGIEDIYNKALHDLPDGDGENLSVKDFLLMLLEQCKE